MQTDRRLIIKVGILLFFLREREWAVGVGERAGRREWQIERKKENLKHAEPKIGTHLRTLRP